MTDYEDFKTIVGSETTNYEKEDFPWFGNIVKLMVDNYGIEKVSAYFVYTIQQTGGKTCQDKK